MNEEDALLRAICERPDDDTSRLVFADWLQEQGDPVNTAWANGIRTQVWLARGTFDAQTTPRPRVFESSFGVAKIQARLGIPMNVGTGEWARGFPTQLGGDFHAVRDAWPRLAFRVPCCALHLNDVSHGAVEEFVTWPALQRLVELTLSSWQWPTLFETDFAALANCDTLTGLEALTVSSVQLTDSVANALLTSASFVNLRKLRLYPHLESPSLSPTTEERLRARFGPEVFG